MYSRYKLNETSLKGMAAEEERKNINGASEWKCTDNVEEEEDPSARAIASIY